MNITQLTVLGFELNGAIDSGNYQNISIKDIQREIENGSILEYLEKELGRDILGDFSIQEKNELKEHWESLENVTVSTEFLVKNNGLNLLIAYVLEGIQNGTSRDGRLPTQRQ